VTKNPIDTVVLYFSKDLVYGKFGLEELKVFSEIPKKREAKKKF
jgi:hypothetical protein